MIVVNTRKLVKVRSSILSLKHLTLITCTWRRGKILDEKAQRKNAINSSVRIRSMVAIFVIHSCQRSGLCSMILPSHFSEYVSPQTAVLCYLRTI